MPRHRSLPLRLSATLSICLSAALAGAQPPAPAEPPATSPPLFVERLNVNVVNVEVFVTDHQGNRVAGLTKDDFEILEDGKPVEISNFFAVTGEDRLISGLARDRALVHGEAPPKPRRELPPEQRLNLVVYVDNYNISPHSRTQVLDDLDAFVDQRVTQGDNVMVASYDGGLKVEQRFTRNREALADALKRVGKQATYGQVDELRLHQVQREMIRYTADPNISGGVEQAYDTVRSYVQQKTFDLRASLIAFDSLVRSLAGLPGRKALLYVSDGLPQRPGEELYQQLTDLVPAGILNAVAELSPEKVIDPSVEAVDADQTLLFKKITREANAHQVTLYTLDARGTNAGSSQSAEFAETTAGGAGHVTLDSLRSQNLQEPLIELAESTGGSSILNTANFDAAFNRLGNDFDSFYSLGFRTSGGGDGKYHAIDVRVKRPGLVVRHRAGYIDKPEAERVADRTLSSLILDMEANPLGVSVAFGNAKKQGRDRYLLPVLVRIPIRLVTLLPNGDVQEGHLRIHLAVRDEKGRVSDLTEIPYPVRIPSDQLAAARSQDIGYTALLKVRGGKPRVAVGVWDELSGLESFVHKEALVGRSGRSSERPGVPGR